MTEVLNQPAVQIAALVLGGLFLLVRTRKQGLILSLLCMVVCLGVVMIIVDVMAQEQPDVGAVISKRIIVINETEFIESEPIIETITEHFVIVTPNEDPVPAPALVSASWGSVAPAVARWQPNINQAIAHCFKAARVRRRFTYGGHRYARVERQPERNGGSQRHRIRTSSQQLAPTVSQ